MKLTKEEEQIAIEQFKDKKSKEEKYQTLYFYSAQFSTKKIRGAFLCGMVKYEDEINDKNLNKFLQKIIRHSALQLDKNPSDKTLTIIPLYFTKVNKTKEEKNE